MKEMQGTKQFAGIIIYLYKEQQIWISLKFHFLESAVLFWDFC